MKQATLILGLKTTVVLRTDAARYYNWSQPLVATDGSMLVPTESIAVEERIIPISQFCRPGKPDLYIAYSEEVEELLGVPFRTIYKEVQETREEISRLRSLTWWEHIKCAWQAWRRPT
jgi:hypothetical protein